MSRYSDRVKQAAALVMAVWFFAASGLVHCLHNHTFEGSAGPIPNDTVDSRVLSPSGLSEGLAALLDGHAPNLHSGGRPGDCLACLLVNTCNEGAVEWKLDAQDGGRGDRRFRVVDSAFFSRDVTFRPSRAPPLSLV